VYVTSKVAFNSASEHGTFVTRLRADHSVAWSETISTLPSDIANAVALSPSGDLFITGATFLTFGPEFRQEDAFLIKIDRATGAAIWVAEGGGTGTDYPTALAFDGDGNIYVGGLTQGSVVDGVANQGSFDIFAMKFSPDGKQLAAWQRGTPAFDQITSMAVDRCGRVFVGGSTGGAIVPGHASAGREDMFVMKADLR
jgi:outer membrane protein assembly factor BamB